MMSVMEMTVDHGLSLVWVKGSVKPQGRKRHGLKEEASKLTGTCLLDLEGVVATAIPLDNIVAESFFVFPTLSEILSVRLVYLAVSKINRRAKQVELQNGGKKKRKRNGDRSTCPPFLFPSFLFLRLRPSRHFDNDSIFVPFNMKPIQFPSWKENEAD
jgi:hypothetical protein